MTNIFKKQIKNKSSIKKTMNNVNDRIEYYEFISYTNSKKLSCFYEVKKVYEKSINNQYITNPDCNNLNTFLNNHLSVILIHLKSNYNQDDMNWIKDKILNNSHFNNNTLINFEMYNDIVKLINKSNCKFNLKYKSIKQ